MMLRNGRVAQRLFAGVCAGVLSLASLAMAQAQSTSYTLIADRAVMPDGSLRANVAVEVRDGRIARVIAADQVAANANARRLPAGAVLAPGLIDLASSLGVEGSQVEDTSAIDAEVNIEDGFDATDRSLRIALEGGVTSAMVIPAPRTIVSGHTFTTRTAPGTGAVNATASLVMNLSSSAYNAQRGPTSRAGLLFELRTALNGAKDQPASNRSALSRAVRGEMPVVLICETVEEIDSAMMLIGEYGLNATLAITDAAIEVVDDLAEAEVPVVFGPLDFNSSRRSLMLPGLLAKAGVNVGFHGSLPAREPESLRTTAALAVRYGMDPAAARRAMTSTAASIAGAADRLGAIREGLAADFVIYSADPLRLDARVLEVHVNGRRQYVAPSAKEDHDLDS